MNIDHFVLTPNFLFLRVNGIAAETNPTTMEVIKIKYASVPIFVYFRLFSGIFFYLANSNLTTSDFLKSGKAIFPSLTSAGSVLSVHGL